MKEAKGRYSVKENLKSAVPQINCLESIIYLVLGVRQSVRGENVS